MTGKQVEKKIEKKVEQRKKTYQEEVEKIFDFQVKKQNKYSMYDIVAELYNYKKTLKQLPDTINNRNKIKDLTNIINEIEIILSRSVIS